MSFTYCQVTMLNLNKQKKNKAILSFESNEFLTKTL
jgi:hypothetical protein